MEARKATRSNSAAERAHKRKIHFQTKKQNKQFINHKAFRYLLEKSSGVGEKFVKSMRKKFFSVHPETDDGTVLFFRG